MEDTIINPAGNPNLKAVSYYWLCLPIQNGENGEFLAKRLSHGSCVWKPFEGYIAANMGERWTEKWEDAHKALSSIGGDLKPALLQNLNPPRANEIPYSAKSLRELEKQAQNSWLLDYLQTNMIICHFQSVVDRKGSVFGWESFARILTESGESISGHEIIEASKVLNIRHVIDRHLQVLAVRDFVHFNLAGMLFINFMPDFILKPSKYLEGLDAESRRQGLLTRRIVLEFPISFQTSGKISPERVVDFCRSKGYFIALDDVRDFAECERIFPLIRPDFIKLDRNTAQSESSNALSKLIKYAHANNCTVLAEGVEDEDTFKKLHKLGVDLFQGYHFSKPERPGI